MGSDDKPSASVCCKALIDEVMHTNTLDFMISSCKDIKPLCKGING